MKAEGRNPRAERRPKAETRIGYLRLLASTACAEGRPTTRRLWCSADFESAVSQNFNLPAQLRGPGHARSRLRSLSDAPQTANLRYSRLEVCATFRAPIGGPSSSSVSKAALPSVSTTSDFGFVLAALSHERSGSGFGLRPSDF
jgi:hypothetical protein